MYRIILLNILFIVLTGNSLFALSKKRDKEISTAKKLEHIADSLLNEKKHNEALGKFHEAAIIFEKNPLARRCFLLARKCFPCLFTLLIF